MSKETEALNWTVSGMIIPWEGQPERLQNTWPGLTHDEATTTLENLTAQYMGKRVVKGVSLSAAARSAAGGNHLIQKKEWKDEKQHQQQIGGG